MRRLKEEQARLSFESGPATAALKTAEDIEWVNHELGELQQEQQKRKNLGAKYLRKDWSKAEQLESEMAGINERIAFSNKLGAPFPTDLADRRSEIKKELASLEEHFKTSPGTGAVEPHPDDIRLANLITAKEEDKERLTDSLREYVGKANAEEKAIAGADPFSEGIISINSYKVTSPKWTRRVDFKITIDPQVLSLRHIEEMRPEDAVVKVELVLVPDAPFAERMAERLARGFEKRSRTYSQSRLQGMFPTNPELSEFLQFPGSAVQLKASLENDPGRAGSLRNAGFLGLSTPMQTKYRGKKYKLNIWVRREEAADSFLGSVTARIQIKENHTVDGERSVLLANFERIGEAGFKASKVPDERELNAEARERYKEFMRRSRQELDQALAVLNAPLNLLTQEEREQLGRRKEGEELTPFAKTIEYNWFGVKKSVNVKVKGTLGASISMDTPLGN